VRRDHQSRGLPGLHDEAVADGNNL
ncbi:uncharacterized protein METZ01_LOCUS138205, partial [marine metagenome]